MIKVGIERIDDYLELFKNKRVGLITNPTGVCQNFKTTIEVLQEKTNLVSLFSPEHGVRGDLQAGVKLDPYVDEKTGSMVYSLYGETRKPTKEMLADIDILAYDIQDVGARFYTFIYTMAYSMQAAKDENKLFVVFDRPNPLGGLEVEGNILDLKYRSFVGYYPMVQRYGLTVGELAKYFNEAFEIDCNLKVIPMEGYKRGMDYVDTGLPFVMPSPNIPTPMSIYSYMATCLIEGTNLSEGRGTTKPFEVLGAPWLNASNLIKRLEGLNLPGIKFRKLHFTPIFSKHKDTLCEGIELYITDKKAFKPVKTGFAIVYLIKELHEEFDFIKPWRENQLPFFNLLTGDDLFNGHYSLDQLFEKIDQDSKTFTKIKERYHLYEV